MIGKLFNMHIKLKNRIIKILIKILFLKDEPLNDGNFKGDTIKNATSKTIKTKK